MEQIIKNKYLFCFGTRPEVIKMAPIIFEMRSKGIAYKICTTGQHREMLKQMLDTFGLKADYNLDIMRTGQSLNFLSASIFSAVDDIIDEVKPDMILVQGDTTTANITAQAAFHRNLKVAHIEAGLRTYKKHSPFPEEINRQIISRIADWHFTPTKQATENLLREGINKNTIFQTGNTVIDALYWIAEKVDEGGLMSNLNLDLSGFSKMILVTGHRRENFGKGMEELCRALINLSENKDRLIVFPVHLNPKTKLIVEKQLQGISNIKLLPPLDYHEMVWLIKKCDIIISDSGGIQEEAPTFKKPVLVTREFTERQEAVKAGYSILTGSNANKIEENANHLLNNPPKFENIPNPFGDGKAAERIVGFLEEKGFIQN